MILNCKDLNLNAYNLNHGELKYLNSSIQKLDLFNCKIDKESMKSLPQGIIFYFIQF